MAGRVTTLAADRLDVLPAISPGPGPYEFVKASISAEGPHLRILLVARDTGERGQKLHVWELLPREATLERLQGALADLWRRLGEA